MEGCFQYTPLILDETKNGEGREVPLNARADAALARRSSSSSERLVFGSDNWDTFRSAWESTLRRAKISNFRWHDLRHTCASWMVQAGRPLQEVKDFLGHKTLAVTLRYAHLAPENLRKAASSLDAVLPGLSTPGTHEPATVEISARKVAASA